MHKLPVSNEKKIVSDYKRKMAILKRYVVPRYAYGFCPACNTLHDYWKCGENDFKCPSCGQILVELMPIEIANALSDCEKDGCFDEEFFYSTPLRPVRVA